MRRLATKRLAGFLGVAALLLAASPAARAAESPAATSDASAPASFSPAQRAEIVAIVRRALVADPSILRDAVTALRADEQREEQANQGDAIAAHHAAILAGPGGAVAGNPVGSVTLTEFYDPRCPYCKRMVPTVAAAIAADHQLRVVYKVIPILGAQSVLEARAIVAAGLQNDYAGMQQALMTATGTATQASISALATAQHLDAGRLVRDMDGSTVTGLIDDNLALSKALQVDGTPELIVGGTLYPGALGPDDLQRAIAAARS